jgi:hypothetical protein
VQQLADENFALLKSNPQHPSLHFKKVGRFWSARVGLQYRALAVEGEDASSGSGLATTTSTSASSAGDAKLAVSTKLWPGVAGVSSSMARTYA